MLKFHRKEQWDLDCVPIVCVHHHKPHSSTRVFCLWSRGIQIGSLLVTTKGIAFAGRHRWPRRRAS